METTLNEFQRGWTSKGEEQLLALHLRRSSSSLDEMKLHGCAACGESGCAEDSAPSWTAVMAQMIVFRGSVVFSRSELTFKLARVQNMEGAYQDGSYGR